MAASVFLLVDGNGRKYLTAAERTHFLDAARADPRPAVQTFAATLVHTGARISEALAVRACDVDLDATTTGRCGRKRKRSRVFRVVGYEAPTVSAQAAISARRLSMRSLLAYARSTALPTVWARHSSITAWSASVHSPAQLRNELRKPVTCRGRRHEVSERAGCGKTARPVRRAAIGNGAMAWIEAPVSRKPPATATPHVLPPPRQSSTLPLNKNSPWDACKLPLHDHL